MVAILFMEWRDLLTHSIFLIFVGIIFLGMIFFEYCYSYWRDLKVPTLPATVPFGHFRPFIFQKESFGQSLEDLYFKLKTYEKPYGGCYIFIKPIFIVLDPELAKNILIKDFNHFTDINICFIDENVNPLSNHLLHMNGEKWTNLRNKVSPAFTSGKLKLIFSTIKTTGKHLEDVIKKMEEAHTPIEMQDLLERFTTDVLGAEVFGFECNSLENKNDTFRINSNRAAKMTRFENFVKIISFCFPIIGRHLKFIPDYLRDYFINLVQDTISHRKKNNIVKKDFLQLLMNLHSEEEAYSNDGNVALTLEEIAAQCFMFILAGFENSAVNSTSVMYYLSLNPEIQDKVRKEILEVMGKDGDLTYEHLQKMTYLQQVIDETMRIRPSVSALARQCTKDYTIPGSQVKIKAGTSVMIPTRGFHHDPEYYPNPEVFDPDRFTIEEKGKRHPCTFMPFGDGPRYCIGTRFAMMQIKVGLISLLKNYKYSLNSKTKTPLEENTVGNIINAVGGVWIDISKIS